MQDVGGADRRVLDLARASAAQALIARDRLGQRARARFAKAGGEDDCAADTVLSPDEDKGIRQTFSRVDDVLYYAEDELGIGGRCDRLYGADTRRRLAATTVPLPLFVTTSRAWSRPSGMRRRCRSRTRAEPAWQGCRSRSVPSAS